MTAHAPALQLGVAPARLLLHARLHIPQWVRLSRAVSQPFWGLESQLPQPVAQLGAHTLAAQETVPCALVQGLSQRPQCATVLLRAASQPFW